MNDTANAFAALTDAVANTQVIAIMRDIDADHIIPAGQALVAGGIRALEVTFSGTDEDAIAANAQAITDLIDALPPDVAVGAGTVVTPGQLRAAIAAGAGFIVSPDTNPEIIVATRGAGLASLPGAMTATECLTAYRAGATYVKVFPAGRLGPGYVKDLRGPLPWIRFVAVGAVDLGNARALLDAGCVGLGIGGSLVKKSLVEAGRYDELTALADEYLHTVKGD